MAIALKDVMNLSFPYSNVDCVLHTSLMHLLCKLLIPSHRTDSPDIFIHEHTRSL